MPSAPATPNPATPNPATPNPEQHQCALEKKFCNCMFRRNKLWFIKKIIVNDARYIQIILVRIV